MKRNRKLWFGAVALFFSLSALLLLWGYSVFVHEPEIPEGVSELIDFDIGPRYDFALMAPPDERRFSHLLIDRFVAYESDHRRVADMGAVTISQGGRSTEALCVIVRVTYLHYWPPPAGAALWGKEIGLFPVQDFQYVAWEEDGVWTLRFVKKSEPDFFGKLSCSS